MQRHVTSSSTTSNSLGAGSQTWQITVRETNITATTQIKHAVALKVLLLDEQDPKITNDFSTWTNFDYKL